MNLYCPNCVKTQTFTKIDKEYHCDVCSYKLYENTANTAFAIAKSMDYFWVRKEDKAKDNKCTRADCCQGDDLPIPHR